jgi:hypothetical protein
MEARTIKTEVTYKLNDAGRIAMAKLGLPAQTDQVITLDMPIDTKGLYINGKGIGELKFEYTYNPKLDEQGHAIPQPRGLHIWKRQATIYNNGCYGISTPLLYVYDVLEFVKNQDEAFKAIEALIPSKQTEYDNEYNQKVRVQELSFIKADAIVEAKIQFQKEDESVAKIEMIRNLINGKSRVRTQQIKDIIG